MAREEISDQEMNETISSLSDDQKRHVLAYLCGASPQVFRRAVNSAKELEC
jgi:hypothetical protein